MNEAKIKLIEYLTTQPPLAIAVSGGVDSLTLAWIAHQNCPSTTTMVHAVSPAVPPEATDLVKQYAKRCNWNLIVIDAREYHDPEYKRNPVNRCYYCKTNLYARIKETTGLRIASGTNLDDLGDYRPGLKAATLHGVVHPYVEANIDKSTIRQLATMCGLDDVANLPAQPCLASRVETGIAIDANDLRFINNLELMLRKHLGNGDIRCRITSAGIKIELDPTLFANDYSSTASQKASIDQLAKQYCVVQNRTYRGMVDYERGSAFIHPASVLVPAS